MYSTAVAPDSITHRPCDPPRTMRWARHIHRLAYCTACSPPRLNTSHCQQRIHLYSQNPLPRLRASRASSDSGQYMRKLRRHSLEEFVPMTIREARELVSRIAWRSLVCSTSRNCRSSRSRHKSLFSPSASPSRHVLLKRHWREPICAIALHGCRSTVSPQ